MASSFVPSSLPLSSSSSAEPLAPEPFFSASSPFSSSEPDSALDSAFSSSDSDSALDSAFSSSDSDAAFFLDLALGERLREAEPLFFEEALEASEALLEAEADFLRDVFFFFFFASLAEDALEALEALEPEPSELESRFDIWVTSA